VSTTAVENLALSPVTRHIARRMAKRYSKWQSRSIECDYESLYSVAMLAACRAAQLYEPDRGVQWSTYLHAGIERWIWRHIKIHTRGPWLARPGDCLEDLCHTEDTPIAEPEAYGPLVAAMLRSLTPRHRQVITMRFFEGKTLAECGEVLGINRERVRQIQEKALEALRVDQIRLQVNELRKRVVA
jgi:RNA polymerase sigma factor (sigma-70 family)